MTVSLDLWLNINELGEGLKNSANFRYVLTTSSVSCEEGTILAEGNFKGKNAGDRVKIITNDLHTATAAEEYWLYIWLDAEEISTSTMNQRFSMSLGGECEEVETLVGDAYALVTPAIEEDCERYDDGYEDDDGNWIEDWKEECYEAETGIALTFVRSTTPISVGDTYNGQIITHVYSDFEDREYTYGNLPWNDVREEVTTVVFKDTIRPISTAFWFSDFWELITIDLSKLDTSQVTDMSAMFNITSIEHQIGLENFDTSKVTNMSSTFEEYGRFEMDLSRWDTSNVTDMSRMFLWNTIDTDINVDNWDVSKVTDMTGMFAWSTINVDIDLSNWNVSNVSNYLDFNADIDGDGTFASPTWKKAYFSIYSNTDQSLRLYYIDNSEIPSVGDTFNGKTVTKITNISLTGYPVSCDSTVVPTAIVAENLIIPPLDIDGSSSMHNWFQNCTKVKYIDLSKLDTSKVTNMSSMFKNTSGDSSVRELTIIGVKDWDTSNARYMDEMFYNFGAYANYKLDLSGWNVSKVTGTNRHDNFDYGVANKIIDPLWVN